MPNMLSVLVAALVPMIMGFIWYHPNVFGKTWQRETGLSDEKMKGGNMPLIFGLSFVFSFILAFGLNVVVVHDSFVHGATFYIDKGSDAAIKQQAADWVNTYDTLMANNPAFTTHRLTHGLTHGFLIAGLFIMMPIMVTNALFERKSWKYTLINIGYWYLTLMIMGGIIAAWR